MKPKEKKAVIIQTGKEITVYRHKPSGEWVDSADFETSYKAKELRFN